MSCMVCTDMCMYAWIKIASHPAHFIQWPGGNDCIPMSEDFPLKIILGCKLAKLANGVVYESGVR